jgi:NAD(P)-dependent dehydrogenase (short-subunit alcohol dehydrogenase family)
MMQKPVVLITGGSKGIGKAVALKLASIGYDIAISYFDFTGEGKADDSAAKQAREQISQAGASCNSLRADIADSHDRQRLISLVKDSFGRCDMLVNNAGVAPSVRKDLLQAGEESFDRVLSVNLKGPYFLTQAIAKWMIEQKREYPDRSFRICNVSSISAYTSSPARGEYCISKAGVSMMTKLYADRLAEFGIGVFEIRPGIIATDMTAGVKDSYDKLIAEGLTPTPRWGQPEDVAEAVAAIAEGRLDFSTGQVINVDGGFHLRRL